MPEIRISQQPPAVEPEATSVQAPVAEVSEVRKYLLSLGNSAIADRGFQWLMTLCALSIFFIVFLIAWQLVARSQMSWHAFGMKFFYQIPIDPYTNLPNFWDPVNNQFSALPFLYGTLLSSLIALAISVPMAIGLAIFLTEMCPRRIRGPLSFLSELLAAIPSVIYGLWAVFVLVPIMRAHVNPLLEQYFGWTGLFTDSNPTGLGFTTAGIILAVMILPIISSLTRDVMSAVPHSQREAVLALGATRWEMIRTGVLRNARIGIVGAIILGLGRALGETMAVAMVIGNSPEIHRSLLSNGSSMAAVIANEYAEAVGDMHLSALTEIGLALFVVTIIVNALARLLMWAVTRGTPSQVH
ncbi:MAG: phosphate ABC transporter permease subunit PstC [Acidobacteriota bacterium]|nr:phosphate ABC transporter permease subunit PstC [Acidobacteriota bacterium]